MGRESVMKIGWLRRRTFVILTFCIALVLTLTVSPWPATAGGRPSTINGPLLLIEQRGQRSQQVQIGAGQDEILSVEGGRVRRILGALTATCCGLGGLASSPSGRYIAFTQEYATQDKPPTEGLWIVTTQGTNYHRLLRPPHGQSGPLSIAPLAWSPDGYTLAYAVDFFTDTPVNPHDIPNAGIWLTRYDSIQPRLLVTQMQLDEAAPQLIATCGPISFGPTITALSWAPDGRTLTASINCAPVSRPGHIVQAIVAVDVPTRQIHPLVMGGHDATFSPTTGQLAYVVDGTTGTNLWVANERGQSRHVLVTTPTRIGSLAWSPDGRAIAYLTSTADGRGTVLDIVDIATGHHQIVLSANRSGLPVGGYFTRVAWARAPVS